MTIKLNITPCVEIDPKSTYAKALQAKKIANETERNQKWAEVEKGFGRYCETLVKATVRVYGK